MKRILVLLLILLKKFGPIAACSSTCNLLPQSWACDCDNRGLSSVPQFLPTTIRNLNLENNVITTVSQSDFSRYTNVDVLNLESNQLSVINSRAFYNLSRLAHLHLENNQLTRLTADMFVGLDNLGVLDLRNNNIHSIEGGTFTTTPKLYYLILTNNNISTLAAGTFVNPPRLKFLWLGVTIGILLALAIFLTIWCAKRRVKTSPAPDLSDVRSKSNDAPTRDLAHTRQGASAARAADHSSDDVESRAGRLGIVPLPYSFDNSSAVLRPPLPPITAGGSQAGYQNGPAKTDDANSYGPLKNHFIYQQTCPSGLPKSLAGL
uniref:LRRNT domain-containing protein n=1 Tax=Branchiostoma floridae TaxID=7739 RepID=C3ZQ62_BRAFL|eukprot:XP_002589430.1 hypothetical protein BRAFLDRAFT_80173 [Branchiostoma floridae]